MTVSSALSSALGGIYNGVSAGVSSLGSVSKNAFSGAETGIRYAHEKAGNIYTELDNLIEPRAGKIAYLSTVVSNVAAYQFGLKSPLGLITFVGSAVLISRAKTSKSEEKLTPLQEEKLTHATRNLYINLLTSMMYLYAPIGNPEPVSTWGGLSSTAGKPLVNPMEWKLAGTSITVIVDLVQDFFKI